MSLANDANNTFSSQMIKEYDVFKKTRTVELKQGLAAYADCHVDFYQKVSSTKKEEVPKMIYNKHWTLTTIFIFFIVFSGCGPMDKRTTDIRKHGCRG